MQQKSYDELIASFAALFTSGNNIAPADFHTHLANLLYSLKVPKIYPDVTEFTGTNGIDKIVTVGLSAGTVIEVIINDQPFKYILKAGSVATVGNYTIRPDDYAKPGNEVYWQLANVYIQVVVAEDLDEGGSITITHNLGFKYCTVQVFKANLELQKIADGSPAVYQFINEAANSEYCYIFMNDGISGDHYVVCKF